VLRVNARDRHETQQLSGGQQLHSNGQEAPDYIPITVASHILAVCLLHLHLIAVSFVSLTTAGIAS
jgi:hypothetical protein